MERNRVTIEGNEAVATIAHALSEVIAIYPITPSTPMGELADAWQAAERPNLWGTVPRVIEMQSEGGAAGVLHGALQTGVARDDIHRLAGFAAHDPQYVQNCWRTDASGLSCGSSLTGNAGTVDLSATIPMSWQPARPASRQLASRSVQEAQDLALIAHVATLASPRAFSPLL